MGWLTKLFKTQKSDHGDPQQSGELPPPEQQMDRISASLTENLVSIKRLLGDSPDVITRSLELVGGQGRAGLVYIEGLVDKDTVNKHIVEPLMTGNGRSAEDVRIPRGDRSDAVRTRLLTTVHVRETHSMDHVIQTVLTGHTALLIDGTAAILIVDTIGFEKRAIEPPETEVSVRGSRVAFIESLSTNVAMLRRQLPTPDLRMESFVIGRLTRTQVRLVWITGVANPKIVEEARRRIRDIDVNFLTGPGMIVELIEDQPLSIWPQIVMTERPDIMAANLAEGRFAVFCDGVPYALIAPALFWQNVQSVDDYVERPVVGSFFRLIRQVSFYISLMATSFYVAIIAYNQSIIPPTLALRIAAGRASVPFPSVLETLVLTLTIDILREAGVRLPKVIGSAVGILGAVVIGQAAVSAGFVSPSLIIVVAIAAIANFAIPSVELANATRMANYFLIIMGGILGIFGVVWGMIFLLWGIVSMRSFGIPLFYPVAPGELYGLKDIFIRAPVWSLRRQPSLLVPDNQIRLGESTIKPKPPRQRSERKR